MPDRNYHAKGARPFQKLMFISITVVSTPGLHTAGSSEEKRRRKGRKKIATERKKRYTMTGDVDDDDGDDVVLIFPARSRSPFFVRRAGGTRSAGRHIKYSGSKRRHSDALPRSFLGSPIEFGAIAQVAFVGARGTERAASRRRPNLFDNNATALSFSLSSEKCKSGTRRVHNALFAKTPVLPSSVAAINKRRETISCEGPFGSISSTSLIHSAFCDSDSLGSLVTGLAVALAAVNKVRDQGYRSPGNARHAFAKNVGTWENRARADYPSTDVVLFAPAAVKRDLNILNRATRMHQVALSRANWLVHRGSRGSNLKNSIALVIERSLSPR